MQNRLWPNEHNPFEMNNFYGNCNGGGVVDQNWYARNMVKVIPPFQMVYSGGGLIHSLMFHRKCAAEFAEALQNIKNFYGSQEAIEAARAHITGGSFCFRLMRGSHSKLSVHSWGAAIDIDPARNPFPAQWRPGMISKNTVKCFTDAGLVWRGANGDDDCMHFQAVRR